MTAKTAGLNGYTVSLPNQRGQVKLGPPNVYAAQPHYDRNNKDLTVRVAGEGVPVREAALQAVNSRLPQNLELQGISRHKAGIAYMELGVKNQNVVRLYNCQSRRQGSGVMVVWHGVHQFAKRRLCPSKVASELLHIAVRGGKCYEDIASASLHERAASNSGLKACFKGADAQRSSLCIFSSQLKPPVELCEVRYTVELAMLAAPLCTFTSHGSAAAGRTIPPTARPTPSRISQLKAAQSNSHQL
ncbi:TPA: hypothetical protein ACH3X2_000525 [Trebouxia sp. C0005]